MIKNQPDISLLNPENFIVLKLFVFNPVFKAWSFEPYIKCSYRCIYCSSDAQGKSAPAVDNSEYAKTLAYEVDIVQASVATWKLKAPIMMSLITDPYSPAEAEHHFTRQALHELVMRHLPYNIITKGILVEEDIDLFKRSSTDYRVFISVGATDEDNQKHVEAHVPALEKRMALIKKMHKAGIPVTLNIAPWIPGITDVDAIVKMVSSDVAVSVCALEYHELINQRYFSGNEALKALHVVNEGLLGDWMRSIFKQGFSNSTKAVYGNRWSQKEINQLYVAERIRLGNRPNIFWAEPPQWEGSRSLAHCIKSLDVGDGSKHA